MLPRESPFKPFYEAAKAKGWDAHALPCGHDVMLDLPDELTEILDGAGKLQSHARTRAGHRRSRA